MIIFFNVIVFEISFSQDTKSVKYFEEPFFWFLPFDFYPSRIGPLVSVSIELGEIFAE